MKTGSHGSPKKVRVNATVGKDFLAVTRTSLKMNFLKLALQLQLPLELDGWEFTLTLQRLTFFMLLEGPRSSSLNVNGKIHS